MKLKLEISPEYENEVIIRSKVLDDEVRRIQSAVLGTSSDAQIALFLGDSEYFLPVKNILFFETVDGKVTAHTKDSMLYSEQKLYELGNFLPHTFVRVSKSCIVNSAKIESLSRAITGTAEARFSGSVKIAYISRMYYKDLKERIFETRLSR